MNSVGKVIYGASSGVITVKVNTVTTNTYTALEETPLTITLMDMSLLPTVTYSAQIISLTKGTLTNYTVNSVVAANNSNVISVTLTPPVGYFSSNRTYPTNKQ